MRIFVGGRRTVEVASRRIVKDGGLRCNGIQIFSATPLPEPSSLLWRLCNLDLATARVFEVNAERVFLGRGARSLRASNDDRGHGGRDSSPPSARQDLNLYRRQHRHARSHHAQMSTNSNGGKLYGRYVPCNITAWSVHKGVGTRPRSFEYDSELRTGEPALRMRSHVTQSMA